MKKFLVCNASKKEWKKPDLIEGDEHLIVYCKDLKTIFEAWRQITPSVKRVTINVFTEDPVFTIDPFYLNPQVNTSIKEIIFNTYTHDFWLKFILDTCPNLESLYFYKLTKEKVKYAAENLESLTNIYCSYMDEDTKEFYKQMKTTEKDINSGIKISFI